MNSGPFSQRQVFEQFALGVQMGLKALYQKLNHVKLLAVGNYADLIESLQSGRLEDVTCLIEKQDIEAHWHLQRNLALKLSLEKGYIGVARRLLENPLVVQELSQSGHLVLYKAMELCLFRPSQEHLQFFTWLIDTHQGIQNTAADGGNAVLSKVAHFGDEILFDILIQQSSVFNAIAVGANRVLSSAAANQQVAMVEKLLEIPKVVDELRHSGRMVLGHACASGSLQTVQRLLDYPEVEEQVTQHAAFMGPALLSAARKGHLAVVNFLLQYESVRLSLQDPKLAKQVLSAAIYIGADPVIHRLMDIPGARESLNTPIEMGHPVYYAVTLGKESLIQYFLEDADVKNQVRGNALVVEAAFRYHHPHILNLLCKSGATLKGIRDFWSTPHLHFVNTGEQVYQQEALEVLNALYGAYGSLKHRHKINKLSQDQRPSMISPRRAFPESQDSQAALEYAQGIVSHPGLPLDVAIKINSYLPYTTLALSQRYSLVAKTQVDIEDIEELTSRLERIQF